MFIRGLPERAGGLVSPGGGSSGFTPGAIIIADTAGALNEDASNFFYSSTTHKATARAWRASSASATTDDVFVEWADGQTVPVSNASEGRIRYNASVQSFQVSENGGAWADLSVGGNAFLQNGNAFGATAVLGTTDANALSFLVSNTQRWQITTGGHLLAIADNTYNIGAVAATRPQTIFLGTSLVGGTDPQTISWGSSGYTTFSGGVMVSTAANGFRTVGSIMNATATTAFFQGDAGRNVALFSALTAASALTDFTLFTSGTTRTAGLLLDAQNNTTSVFKIAFDGKATFTEKVSTTGAPNFVTLTPGAHTTLTGEAPSLVLATASQQWASASGTQSLLRAVIFNAPTYTMDGAATITTAITLDVTGTPIMDGTAANTNLYGVRVNNTASVGSASTTAAGLQVFSPQTTGSGSVTNPRAIIAGGTATVAFANGATFNYATISVPAHTVTVSNTAMTIATSTASAVALGQITISSTQNITNAATLYIANAPTMAGGGAITNAYALWVDAGNVQFDGTLRVTGNVSCDSTFFSNSGYQDYNSKLNLSSDGVGAVLNAPGSNGYVKLQANSTTIIQVDKTAVTITPAASSSTAVALTLTQPVNTGGSPNLAKFTGGAHTGLAASTEAIDVNWDLSRTVQFSTGALTLQRAVLFDTNATYGFVGASTATQVIGMHITAPPTQGTNATFTNTLGMLIGNDAANATATNTIASAAGAKFIMTYWASHTISLTGTTTLTGSPAISAVNIDQITVNTTGGGITVTNSASLYVAGAPIAGGSVTLSNKYAIWVDGGLSRFDGDGTNVWEVPPDTTTTAGTRAGRIGVKLTGDATQYWIFLFTIP